MKEKQQERLKVKQSRQDKDNGQEGRHFCRTLKLFPDGLFTIAKNTSDLQCIPKKCECEMFKA